MVISFTRKRSLSIASADVVEVRTENIRVQTSEAGLEALCIYIYINMYIIMYVCLYIYIYIYIYIYYCV